MRNCKGFFYYAEVASLCAIMGLTSCSNGNLFGKLNKSGDDGDVASLKADAQAALSEGDYASALHLYERILNQDSDNSEALYGAAAAAIQSSGINIGQLIANVSHQNSAPSFSGLSELISQSRRAVSASAINLNQDSLLYGIDLDSLDAVLDTAICRLTKIVTGATDGTIRPNDVDVLLNLGVLYLLRAVVRPLNLDLLDIKNVNGSYDLVVDPSLTVGVCDGSQLISGFDSITQEAFLTQIAKDINAAYDLFGRAVTVLGLSGNQIIVRLQTDIGEARTELLTDSDVPAACLTIFNNATFDVFTAPTGC
jgi:tetratricopeptide (TPR) repeat protein